MNQSKNSTATKRASLRWLALLGCWLALSASAWAAQVAGTITQLSGPLLDKKADGAVKILSLKSEVENGDTLVTEKNTYAQVKFIDNSEITLKPGTTFKIENFSFDEGKPGGDSATFNLVKGGLRSVTGLLGKRNKEKFEMKTPSATIGIRGTTFIAEWVDPSETAVAAAEQARLNYLLASTAGPEQAAPLQPLQLAQAPAGPSGGLNPGLYVHVIDGLIQLTNRGGVQQFAAGQFGFTPSLQTPPIVVPQNPGLKFTPPPVFNSSTGPSAQSTPPKSNTVDCEVR